MRWSDPGVLAAIGIGAAVLSAAGTRLARSYAWRKGLFDQPGERRSHVVATPRGGGIGIVVACLGLLLLVAAKESQPLPWGLVAAGLLLVLQLAPTSP